MKLGHRFDMSNAHKTPAKIKTKPKKRSERETGSRTTYSTLGPLDERKIQKYSRGTENTRTSPTRRGCFFFFLCRFLGWLVGLWVVDESGLGERRLCRRRRRRQRFGFRFFYCVVVC